MSVNDQSLIGTILPTVHFQKIILESGGDTNPMVSDDPHIMDKSHGDESNFMNAIAIDQIGEATGNKPNPKTWDATADINDEADTMTTTINFVLKDQIDISSQNTMWMFNNIFLNHVKLLVVQMSHYEYADSSAYSPNKYYESKIYNWLAQYNRKNFKFDNLMLSNWKAFNDLKSQDSNIKDYTVQEFSLREVIEYGIPKYLDILKENPDSPTDITNPEIQNAIISSLLQSDSLFSYSESQPLQVEKIPASDERIVNIPFQVKFTLGKEDPLGLSYMAFTYFDYESFSTATDYYGDNIFPDLDFSYFFGAGSQFVGGATTDEVHLLIHSTPNVKEVIKNGDVNKTDVLFLLEDSNNQQYFGNVKAVDPASSLAVNTTTAKPFLDNGYNENPGDYTLLGFNYYTDNMGQIFGSGQAGASGLDMSGYQTPFANLALGDKPLTLVKAPESIIDDSRIFKKLEQIQFQFENFSNNLVGAKNLHAYNQNIVLNDPAVFTDAWLSLEAKQENTLYGPRLNCNFMFGIDVGSLLEKQSLFNWFYKIDSSLNIAPFSETKKIRDTARAETKIKDLQIVRRAVKELNFNPDFAENRFESYKGDDPDPHTSGHYKEISYQPPNQTFPDGSPFVITSYDIIAEDEITYQVVSQAAPDFGVALYEDNSPMAMADFNMNFEQVGLNFQRPLGIGNVRSRYVFISGVDSRFPENANKRYQYGVRFKVQDGIRLALKSALNTLLAGKLALDAIEDDLKIMVYAAAEKNFPIVDPKTGLFVKEYLNHPNTLKALKNVTVNSLSSAIGAYLGVIGLFAFDTEHVQIAGTESYKIVNKLKNEITEKQRTDLLKAISPFQFGSARLFLKFKKSYDEVVASLRSLLKEKKTTSTTNTVDGTDSSAVYKFKTQKNLIEMEYYFPQTMRSPSNGLTGYDYVTRLEEDSNSNENVKKFKNLPSSVFDNIVNRDCFKYFRDSTTEVIPSLPLGSGKKFQFGTPEVAKYNFLTPSKVFVDRGSYNLRPALTTNNDSAEPFAGFNTTNINYSNIMLRIIARAETSKAEYPQILDAAAAYNNDFQLEDSYIASQIMSARNCVVEGKSSYYSGQAQYATPEDAAHEPAYIILSAFDGATQIDLNSVEAEDLPGIIDIQEVKQKVTQYQQDISTAANLLVHLIAHDEFKYMFNLNKSNFLVQDVASTVPSTDNLLEKLRIKYDSAALQDYGYFPTISVNFAEFLLHGIPNSLKYMFTVANSSIGGASSTLFNPYFQSMLEKYLDFDPANFNSMYGKENLATIYFNFFNIVKVQYLSGFGVMESGKTNLKDPIWKNLSSSDNEEPDFYNNPAGSKILCRLMPYDDSELVNNQLKYLDLPILNKYFFVTL